MNGTDLEEVCKPFGIRFNESKIILVPGSRLNFFLEIKLNLK